LLILSLLIRLTVLAAVRITPKPLEPLPSNRFPQSCVSLSGQRSLNAQLCVRIYAAECDFIIKDAKPRLERSGVSDSETGEVGHHQLVTFLALF
jgi:hypothetical protein